MLLYPEQDRATNVNLCVNWFEPCGMGRGKGEGHSIHQMIEAVVHVHGIDRALYHKGDRVAVLVPSPLFKLQFQRSVADDFRRLFVSEDEAST